jgi:hypothetical protein
MNAIDIPPGNGDLGILDAMIVSTNNPFQSVLLYRMELRDGLFQMPPLGTSRVDWNAVDLLSKWMLQLQIPPMGAIYLLLLGD